MTLRIAVLGCLLAAAGQAQGTDGQPITMHNDPTTFFNGSAQLIFQARTFADRAKVPALLGSGSMQGFPPGFFPRETGQTILQHCHPGGNGGLGQSILVLQPSATVGILEKVTEIRFRDGDALHISLIPSGEIVVRKGSIPGAAAAIPTHAGAAEEFDVCLKAVTAPMRAAGRASDSAPRGMKPTHITWRSSAKTVLLGTKIALDADVTTAGGTVPAAQTTLFDNGANLIAGALQNGGRAHFLVTLTVAGDHCFAVAYPLTQNFAASKSAEICVRVLPLGCPVMSAEELTAQKTMAAKVANTVWGIVADKPWVVGPDQNHVRIVKYPTPTALMSSMWLESNATHKIPINGHCGVVHFCHMRDVDDGHGNWSLQRDCGPVKFTCHPNEDYTWTPPSDVSQQTKPSDRIED
jgi:hypothetical protein